MGLLETNESLHGRDAHLERAREHTTFDPEGSTPDPTKLSEFQKTESWETGAPLPVTPPISNKLQFVDEKKSRRKKIAFALGGIALVLLVGGIVFKVRGMLFDEKRMELSIAGPKDVASAEPVNFTFTYSNRNWSELLDATLVLTYPEQFHPEADGKMKLSGSRAEIPVGTIADRSDGKVTVTGKFYGSKGDTVPLRAVLSYKPKSLSNVIETKAEYLVNVASSPLLVEISAPLEIGSDQDVDYVIEYANKGDKPFSNLKMKLTYPPGFQFLSADPKPTEGNAVWNVGTLSSDKGGKIVVRGTLAGSRDERKTVRGEIGFLQGDGKFLAYATSERQTKIVTSPLAISQTVNKESGELSVDPGTLLHYTLKYKNEGTIGLRDAIVTFSLDSPYVDTSLMVLTTGSYDDSKKMITWRGSDISGLARIDPGREGLIEFSIPVKKSFTFSSDAQDGLSVRTVAKIDSPDVPTTLTSNKIVGTGAFTVKINSLVALDIKGYHLDFTIPNTGPIPPKVGEETTYTLHLKAQSSTNPVTAARAVIVFPSGVVYKGKSSPGSEIIKWNERSNELFWEIGTLAPTEKRELVFQIGVTPSSAQLGQSLTLMNKADFTGKDSFTGKDIKTELGSKKNDLTEDTSLPPSSDKVVPAS